VTKYEFAFGYMIKNEGGDKYTDIPQDRGGCTKWGITLHSVLTDQNLKHIRTCEDLKHMNEAEAKGHYYRVYWRFGEINNWRVAAKMFDIFVNLPPGSAKRIYQRAANQCGAGIQVDGVIGQQSITAINRTEPENFLLALSDELVDYYSAVVKNRPEQKIFLKGWVNRALRHPPQVPNDVV
jgi:lysozyme family protein